MNHQAKVRMSMRSKIADRVQQSPTAALRKVWCAIAVFLLALALPFPALALPEESRVPGGIALVRLGKSDRSHVVL